MVAKVPSATLKFDTDFDFDYSNAQFHKEALAREVQDLLKMKGLFIQHQLQLGLRTLIQV